MAQAEGRAPSGLARAEGVELLGELHGSGYKEGAALVRRADGQMVQIGPLMYALLDSADGKRGPRELAAAMSAKLGRRFDAKHVERLAEKLAQQGLLAGSEHHAPPRRNPLLALRWKVLVTNPKVTRRLTVPFTFLFSPFLIVPVVIGFAAVCWFVLFDKGVASATAQAFDSPGLLLLVFVLAVASAGFHELGHAAACRYGGAEPGGMGMGIYLVWPAFYTDVTDSYRLPQRDRLRVDLGGLYFNAIVAVVTTAVWLVCRADALLLLVAIQMLMMVKNLSPVIRSDGYHILADATGIPDLYAHIGPTLRRLIPWRPAEPSALKGRARLLVTLWVLIVVPVLLSLMFGAVVLLPRMAASAWDSGRTIAGGMPHEAHREDIVGVGASSVRLLALLLPLAGSALITQRLVRGFARRSHAWSGGRPARRAALVGVAALAATGAAWAWWPAGQYEPVQAADAGTLGGFGHVIASPVSYVRPVTEPSRPTIPPGTHLAVAMIPVGGATNAHPALLVIPGDKHHPAVAILSSAKPTTASTAQLPATTETATAPAATTTTQETPTTTTATAAQPPMPAPAAGVAFDFKLPAAPGPGDTQALAVNHKDGGVTYDIAYALVTVSGGAPVTNTNGAFAFANCKACTTVAVSFQVVLIVGRSAVIAPINAAGSLNVSCPACMTTALADQMVVTLTKKPTPELVDQIDSALKQLDALPELGAGGTPAAVAAQVDGVQKQVEQVLEASGTLANPLTTTGSTTTAPTTTSTVPTTAPTTTTAPSTSTPTTTTAPTTTSRNTTTTQTTTTTPATTTNAGTAPAPTTTTEPTTTTPTTTEETTTTAPTTTTPTTTTTSSGG